MKKLLFVMFLVFALAGCQQVTSPANLVFPVTETTGRYFVYNSEWDLVDSGNLVTARAVGDVPDSVESYVETYNEANNDDQLTLATEEIPIELSPICNIWIVHPTTYEIIGEYLDWDRADLSERRAMWAQQCYADGGILFVDKIPPVPEPVIDLRTPYEKYSLYVIALDGSIVYVDHCSESYLTSSGYDDLDDYFTHMTVMFNNQAYADGNGEYVVSGRIYTPPVIE